MFGYIHTPVIVATMKRDLALVIPPTAMASSWSDLASFAFALNAFIFSVANVRRTMDCMSCGKIYMDVCMSFFNYKENQNIMFVIEHMIWGETLFSFAAIYKRLLKNSDDFPSDHHMNNFAWEVTYVCIHLLREWSNWNPAEWFRKK